MAITKLLSPNTPNPITAGPNGDWDLAMAQLTAVKKLLSGEQMMLTEWTNATTQPKLALGTHLQHKGSIYVVETEDYALPALGGNGTYYIVLEPSGDTLVGSWATDLSGYSWDSTYNGLYNGGKLVLPYQIVVDGSDIVKRKILNPWIDGGFTTVDWMGNVRGASLVVNGNATVGGTLGVTGAISGANYRTRTLATAVDLDTIIDNGHYYVRTGGANNPSSDYCSLLVVGDSDIKSQTLIEMDSNKYWHRIGKLIGQAGESWTAWRLIDQDLSTTASPTFASIDTGHGANEVYKISNETIDFGTVDWSTSSVTKQVSAMASGEIRFVRVTGTLNSNSSDTYYARLNAPSGGTYFVLTTVPSRTSPTTVNGIVVGGGGAIWNIRNHSTDNIDLASTILIRRL